MLFVCVYANAQLSPNSLFIVFDNNEGILKTEKRDISDEKSNYINTTHHYRYHKEIEEFNRNTQKWFKSLSYEYIIPKKYWRVSFSHIKEGRGKNGNYVISLPKEVFELFKEAEKVKTISELQTIWSGLDWRNYSYFFDNYRYYFQLPIMQRGHYRDTIFMVFTSDLEKDYIPCYEVNNYSHQEEYE